MKITEWVKPSGSTVKLNDNPETEAQAARLGWKKKQARKAKAKNVDSSKDSERSTEDPEPK